MGLTLAAELKRYGVAVRIIEKAAQRTDKSKALVVWSRTLELLDRAECARSFIAAGLKVRALNIVSGGAEIARITFDRVASPHPYALMLPQSETERLLEEHLSTLGVEVERNVELLDFTATGENVVSTLRHADGRGEKLETAWLAGCDGAHSTVRHRLGMEFVGDTLPSDWMLADVHLSGAPNPGKVSVIWHAEGVLVFFPIAGERYRVIGDVGDRGAEKRDPTLEEIQALLDQRGPGNIRASAPVWLATFHINERKIADYRAGRVFLAGDASHVHSPAGGQGMNTGMQDAFNLAWKLALVARGVCSPEPLLGSYGTERGAVGERVLKNAGRLTAVAVMRGGIKQAIRNHVAGLVFGLAPVRSLLADTVTEISIGYAESPLNAKGGHVSGGPAAGERAPLRAGEAPVGAGGTPRFALFCEPGEEASRLLARHPDLLEPAVREPFSEGGLWLVRPDGYTSLATKAGRWEEAAAFLEKIAAVPG